MFIFSLANFVTLQEFLLNLIPRFNVLEIITWIYIVVFVVLFLISCFGQQLGLRRKYINFLLKVFEFGSNKIRKKREKRNVQYSEEEPDTPSAECFPNPVFFMDQTQTQDQRKKSDGYYLHDVLPYITAGISTIVEDAVIPQFVSEELPYWNLLSRTNDRNYEFLSLRLTAFWVVGFLIRYCLLLPIRLSILGLGMLILFLCTLIVGPIHDGSFKRKMNSKIYVTCFDFVAGCLSLVATFHNVENRPKSGIAVANHTSPIDSMILATDNCYDMVGQKHGGLIGFFMTLLSRISYHIWFERSESKDRAQVAKRLREHAANPDLPPILVFPEGVCVNNTCVMQFKKGAFEAVDEIHPIAIKFDARFGDAFWWQDQFFNYALWMMTSWAIVCDVWYLPPMRRNEQESAIDFANRVKAAIALKGGLTDLSWDGSLKAAPVKEEWRRKCQSAFARQLLEGSRDGDVSHPQDTTTTAAAMQRIFGSPRTESVPSCSHQEVNTQSEKSSDSDILTRREAREERRNHDEATTSRCICSGGRTHVEEGNSTFR